MRPPSQKEIPLSADQQHEIWQEYVDTATQLARMAIDIINEHHLVGAEISTKANDADYVTVVDHAVEQRVRDVIAERFGDHRVVGEEFGATADDADYTWYVDPIDGTTNFVYGVPWSSFSLALADRDGAIVGVVADPHRNEIIAAARGRGTTVTGPGGTWPARCAGTKALAGAVLLTEWASFRAWPGMIEMLHTLSAAGVTSRVMGSSALSVASAAIGRGSAAVLGGYNTWDVLAAVLIARESGATVLGRDGHPLPAIPEAGDGGLLVSAPSIAEPLWRAWTGAPPLDKP
ncbi:MAG: inositol monophosphatase family protein [Mycobacteriales bacterium]|nr:MAG: inositol monophosphatase [Pseudonocardiales bacterium]